MNTKKDMENCNQKFDMFLQQRNFIIPPTALKMSQVNGNGSGSYDILKSVKLTDAESSQKNSELLVEQGSVKPMNDNVKTASEIKDLSKTNSSLGQDQIFTKSVNVIKKSSLPTRGTVINPQSISSVALAHNSSNDSPIRDFQPLPFCQNIQNAMKRLNLHSIWPMQLLAWSHLMQKNGNSLLLIDNPNSGRTWCYLPALCSLVMRKMQSSKFKLGPVAILLTDLANITKLANDCAMLMQAHNTKFLKVVNASDSSQEDVCRALLDSCGILITTLDKFVNLLEIHNKNDMKLFDSDYLELFVCDDYDRLRLSNAELLNEVLQHSRSILKLPHLRFVLISQQWHRKVFSKLIKDLAGEALILFGDYLEAAIYGGLTMETILRRRNDKLTQLFKYLDQHKSKRILIYCKTQLELQYLNKELTKMDHQCNDVSETESQETHQLLLLSDESSHPEHLIKKNIEVLIHYSMPDSWTKFVFRFHSMMDNIANLMVPTRNPVKVVTHLMLDQTNQNELSRLMVFLDSHGIAMDESIRQVVVSYQQEIEKKRPFCPHLLHSGKCNQKQQCNKRHHFVRSDVRGPKGPMEETGTLVRCNIHKVYDPVHIAVKPIEYKPPGSSKWLPASSDSQFLMALALSMAMKSKPYLALKIGDVCVIHQQGQYKRVRIVDTPQGRPVTVQLMDLGTDLLQVKPMELLECEEKFQIAPPMAMDVRLTQVQPTGGGTAKWTLEAIKWVTNSFKGLNEHEHIQIFVDFAMLDVIYASEIVIIEKCRTMRTSVYKLKLRKELLLKGYAQFQDNIDHIQIEKYKEETKQNSKPNKVMELKENPHLEEPLENDNETTSETKVDCSSRKMNRISLMLAAINKLLFKKESRVELESENIENNHMEPLKEEPPVMDSTTQFFNTLIGKLNNENSSSKNNSAPELINNILGTILEKPKINEEFENTLPTPSSEKSLTDSPQNSNDQITDALKCIKIADGTVFPQVKWRQTLHHIDIAFEQQVTQYKLIHQGNTLSYSAINAEPPQRCVLNLLGEVKIVSEQQHGYILHVKLAKLSLLSYWPTLLNSLYAQQHSHWLTYDTERAKSPPQRMGDVLWQRYVRRLDQTNDTTDDENHQGFYHSSDDQFEPGVERCESLLADYFEDL